MPSRLTAEPPRPRPRPLPSTGSLSCLLEALAFFRDGSDHRAQRRVVGQLFSAAARTPVSLVEGLRRMVQVALAASNRYRPWPQSAADAAGPDDLEAFRPQRHLGELGIRLLAVGLLRQVRLQLVQGLELATG
jgi:hypothetical protein